MIFNDRLKLLRIERSYTQEAAAKAIGISAQKLSEIGAGREQNALRHADEDCGLLWSFCGLADGPHRRAEYLRKRVKRYFYRPHYTR